MIQRFLNVSVPIGLCKVSTSRRHTICPVLAIVGVPVTTTVQQCVIKDTNIFINGLVLKVAFSIFVPT